MKKLFVIFLTILLISKPAYAEDMTVEVIPLNHRVISDVLPVLQPLVENGGTVTGMNNQIIVRSTPANIDEIKTVLASIDKKARRLMIMVKQDINGNLRQTESGFEGRYRSGDVEVRTDPSGGKEGLSIGIEDEDRNSLRYRYLTSRSNELDNSSFSVQTLEGSPAFIQTGHSVPVANQQAFVTGGGVVVQNGVEYRDVTSGFYVLPRLNGDRVTLLVAPQLNRINDLQQGVFNIQNVETTASGYLGEWIQLGGINQNFNSDTNRNLISTRRRGQETRNIAIKVVEIQ